MSDLLSHLRDGMPLKNPWRIPDWLLENKDRILRELPSDEILQRYATYHDCGKPRCKTTDAEGRNHFPDHAEVSYVVWLETFPEDLEVANLIRNDMKLHVLKAEELEAFCQEPATLLCPLLLSSLSEIHSNSSMFGGIDSESFKIKWKNLDRRGKKICKKLFP